jgi:hypothetical protein
MHIVKTALIMGLCGVTATGALAQEEKKPFSLDNLLSDVGTQLDLAGKELDNLKPVLEKKSQEFSSMIDQAVDQGFVQMDKFVDQAKATATDLEKQLDQVLADPQVQELKNFIENLDEKALEDVMDGLVNKMANEIGVTPEQLAQIGPALRQEFEGMGELLDKTLAQGVTALQDFKTESAELWKGVRGQLDDVLSEEQLQKADAVRSDLNEKLTHMFQKQPQ